MKLFKQNKIIAIIIVIAIIVSMIIIIKPTVATTVDVPFGELRIEVVGIDNDGEYEVLNPTGILGEKMEFMMGSSEVTQVEVNIYCTATGEGYDFVELDFQTLVMMSMKMFEDGGQITSLSTPMPDGLKQQTIPLNIETLIWGHTFQLSTFEGSFDITEDHVFVFEIECSFATLRYRGITGDAGSVNLPVTGTSVNTWEQTWIEPVYMDDFHWTQSGSNGCADTHHKYRNSVGSWVEFDDCLAYSCSGNCGPGEHNAQINDDVYGIRIGGWVDSGETIFEWTGFTDINGNMQTSIGSGEATYGPWEDVSIILDIDTSTVTWEAEEPAEYCGDGTCNGDEDCASCEVDCGSCDSRITGYDIDIDGMASEECCNPRMSKYNPSTGEYDDWKRYHKYTCCDYSPELVFPESFWFGSNTNYQYRIRADVDGIAYGRIRLHGPSGQTHEVAGYNDWSDITPSGYECYNGEWMYLAGWANDDTIDEDGDWWVEFDITIQPSGGGYRTLTVEPTYLSDNDQCKITCSNGGYTTDDTTWPYTFSVLVDTGYSLDIDWYDDEQVASHVTGIMPGSDTTITIDHPNFWAISVFCAPPDASKYTICCDKFLGGDNDECVEHAYFHRFIRPNDCDEDYCVEVEKPGNPSGQSATRRICNNDALITFSWGAGGYSIKSYTFNSQVHGDNYIHGDKYLGVKN